MELDLMHRDFFVDMSSSTKIDNKEKDILIFGKDST